MQKLILTSASVLLLVACDREPKPPAGATTTAQAASSTVDQPAAATLHSEHFEVRIDATDCKVKQVCTATVHLASTSGFHVNDDYPYKFVADDVSGVSFASKDAPRTFSKAAGDFTKTSETAGEMVVRFEPSEAKSLPLSGQFKLSVCSADACQIEVAKLALAVPVGT